MQNWDNTQTPKSVRDLHITFFRNFSDETDVLGVLSVWGLLGVNENSVTHRNRHYETEREEPGQAADEHHNFDVCNHHVPGVKDGGVRHSRIRMERGGISCHREAATTPLQRTHTLT